MAIDNRTNDPIMMVNLSSGVSNEEWTNMIDEMYNSDDNLENESESFMIDEDDINDVSVNPKAKELRLSKAGFKTFNATQTKRGMERLY